MDNTTEAQTQACGLTLNERLSPVIPWLSDVVVRELPIKIKRASEQYAA
jgi:hypothetical protein